MLSSSTAAPLWTDLVRSVAAELDQRIGVVVGLFGLVSLIVYVVLVVVTIVSVSRSPLGGGEQALWVLLALFFQPLSVLLWFATGKTVAYLQARPIPATQASMSQPSDQPPPTGPPQGSS
ncbi:hypothetical protein GCM10012275_32210 [Longimycelium tulufanense]|uniref:Cardiolipin synthase N-terminal domain-containing protein n=1 Tax=Longimycelium tulufanense TaxID=907463 RepID=A0A8J3FWC5_9PSEU|nr:hypothetical protein [Longimycelium tulufanense]GGM58598.1 hypothetical protein GCM10012275_32210 [Longimycelium tulufanense]